MRDRVERLRIWLLGSSVFLVLVIVAFLGSARYVRHRLLAHLTAKLGVDVVSDANGWSASWSIGPTTLYKIHASKWQRRSDGKIALHDVSITVYGKKNDRDDRIYGDDFEYDEKEGVVRAMGLVHIDLQAAGAGSQAAGDVNRGRETTAGGETAGGGADGSKVLHVTTSGLVYMQKLGLATTSQYLAFRSGGVTGHATGADYSSDTGLLTLHSAVSISGMSGKRPETVTAAAAILDNRNREAYLTRARYVSSGQTVEADQATLHTRLDGTLSRVEAEGDVTLQANGATTVSQRAEVGLNAKRQPESAVLTGGVRYFSDQPLQQRSAQADQATIAFDTRGQAESAVFTGAVKMVERRRASAAAGEPWSTRDLTAAKVSVALARPGVGTGPSKLRLQDAEATGNAHLTEVDNGSLASDRGEGTTDISADDLKAHWTEGDNGKHPPQLDTVVGRGHTVLRQISADGTEQTSSGDTLDARFRPETSGSSASRFVETRPARMAGAGPPSGARAGRGGSDEAGDIQSAVQQGHVSMVRSAPAKNGGAAGAKTGAPANAQRDVERATAQRAVYDGELNRMTLTGEVQMSDGNSTLWADQVELERATGDASAMGAVKVEYVPDGLSQTGAGQSGVAQSGAGQAGRRRVAAPGSGPPLEKQVEPTHILGDRAELVHGSGIATFYGRPVRLWQGGSQVQAPVIEIDRRRQRLIARGDAPAGAVAAAGSSEVHTVLESAASDRPEPAEAGFDRPAEGNAGAMRARTGVTTLQKPAQAGAGAGKEGERLPGVVRIASGELVYSGALRQAEFTGGVLAETVDGTVRANRVTVYLQSSEDGQAPAIGGGMNGSAAQALSFAGDAVPSLAGSVERMVATGQIEIEQPGRRATGGRLVYTASDRLFVLTGEGKAQPKLVDAVKGTITGASLQFRSGDDSVVVSNHEPGETAAVPGQRLRTDTQAGKDATIRAGKR